MDICEGCIDQESCLSMCNENILPTGNGREEGECPYFEDCKRCINFLLTSHSSEAADKPPLA